MLVFVQKWCFKFFVYSLIIDMGSKDILREHLFTQWIQLLIGLRELRYNRDIAEACYRLQKVGGAAPEAQNPCIEDIAVLCIFAECGFCNIQQQVGKCPVNSCMGNISGFYLL